MPASRPPPGVHRECAATPVASATPDVAPADDTDARTPATPMPAAGRKRYAAIPPPRATRDAPVATGCRAVPRKPWSSRHRLRCEKVLQVAVRQRVARQQDKEVQAVELRIQARLATHLGAHAQIG